METRGGRSKGNGYLYIMVANGDVGPAWAPALDFTELHNRVCAVHGKFRRGVKTLWPGHLGYFSGVSPSCHADATGRF